MSRLVLLACLAALGASTARAEEPAPFRRGEITERTTPGGVAYAVYVPARWKKGRALPLVVHITVARQMPAEHMAKITRPQVAEHLNKDRATRAFHCEVLVEAHNKESPYQKKTPDPARYVTLLDRDAGKVVSVIDDVAEELPVQADRVLITGQRTGAEVALGVAVRRPERFAGVVAKDIQTIALRIAQEGGEVLWPVLPEGTSREALRGLTVVQTYDRIDNPAQIPLRKANNERVRDALLRFGLRRVEVFATGVPKGNRFVLCDGFGRLFELLAEERKRDRWRADRDALLTDAKKGLAAGRLDAGLQLYKQAIALESRRGLEPERGSATLYPLLETEGRRRLAAADARPLGERRATYKKLARLFKGTPLAEEIRTALAAMR